MYFLNVFASPVKPGRLVITDSQLPERVWKNKKYPLPRQSTLFRYEVDNKDGGWNNIFESLLRLYQKLLDLGVFVDIF